jgi:hypothetical protein
VRLPWHFLSYKLIASVVTSVIAISEGQRRLICNIHRCSLASVACLGEHATHGYQS